MIQRKGCYFIEWSGNWSYPDFDKILVCCLWYQELQIKWLWSLKSLLYRIFQVSIINEIHPLLVCLLLKSTSLVMIVFIMEVIFNPDDICIAYSWYGENLAESLVGLDLVIFPSHRRIFHIKNCDIFFICKLFDYFYLLIT